MPFIIIMFILVSCDNVLDDKLELNSISWNRRNIYVLLEFLILLFAAYKWMFTKVASNTRF